MSLVSIPGNLQADKLSHVPAKLTERTCDSVLGLTSRMWIVDF